MKRSLMKSHKAVKQSTAAIYDPRPHLGVMLLYEDFATGTRAKGVIDQLADQPELNADFSLDLWRFNLLHDPELNQRAVENAALADVVLFSAHGWADLPVEVQLWLFHWLQKAGEKPAALVVSLDIAHGESPGENRTLTFLRALAEPIGVDVFAHFGEPGAGRHEWTTDWVEQRVNANSSLLEGILHHRSPYAHWGLNE